MCVHGGGERERERERGGEGERGRERERARERERTSDLSHSARFFPPYFVPCNGPFAPEEKWHRKEHIIERK